MLALEDLWCQSNQQHIRKHDPLAYNYALLSDTPELRDWDAARFSLTFCAGWWPQFFAKFGAGRIYPHVYSKRLGFVSAGHFSFPALKWVQVALRWNGPASQYRLYANGIRMGRENQFPQHAVGPDAHDKPEARGLVREDCGGRLYLGSTALALSALKFYDRALSEDSVAGLYASEQRSPDLEYDEELKRTYLGAGFNPDDWKPDGEWELKLEASLRRKKDLDLFYLQGNTKSARVTDDGLEVHTCFEPEHQSVAQPDFQDEVFGCTLPGNDPVTNGPVFREFAPGEEVPRVNPGWSRAKSGEGTEKQMYLWTWKQFEGDLAVEFEFLLKREFGLGLLCLQASGMQREDFLRDYPLRKSGSMGMVVWENIRILWMRARLASEILRLSRNANETVT